MSRPGHERKRTLRKHMDGVLSFVIAGGLTNAVAEGLNRIARMVNNRASGFAPSMPLRT